ncbi:hypothetical protein [uncultured Winogradskyella sp.]|uniref:hypothetical protein n=1 Tax=uncultured Winogradskyella sp. TaxID=395353 RepID=UPI0026118FC2|nr:hypothetical protein [uncultured Winogradskyella sp.]
MEELNKEEQIKGLMLLVFDKAKRKSKKNRAYGLSKFLEPIVNIDQRTLTRYYNGYILNREKDRREPYNYNLDSLSIYMGFNDFVAYCSNSENLKGKIILIEKNNELEKKLDKIKKVASLSCLILLIVAVLFILKYYKKNCMIWVDNHYEKIRCSGLDNEKKLDEAVLKGFIKIEVCKDSIFFIGDEPIIHYTRHNNKIDFFTDAGEHPIYEGIYTNPITRTIINSRVKSCDSLLSD